jgi:antitoxin component YwqK of YwqJK toxin-antitoxin module
MKNILIIGTLLISSFIFAQEVEPDYEIVGDLVKSTFYHDNGKVSQEGFYKNEKVHGQWVSYDVKGMKKSQGTYNNGVKIGKWLFWDKDNTKEVEYADNRVAFIKNLEKDVIVKN